MPSVNEVIERVDRVKVNPYEDADKARWLMELDGKILREVIGPREGVDPVGPRGPGAACPACGGMEMEWTPESDRCTCLICGWTNAGTTSPEVWPEEGDKPLMVGAPYDRLYDLYLFAMIDYHDREYAGYNNDMELFNAALGEFRRKWRREHVPGYSGGWKGRL